MITNSVLMTKEESEVSDDLLIKNTKLSLIMIIYRNS